MVYAKICKGLADLALRWPWSSVRICAPTSSPSVFRVTPAFCGDGWRRFCLAPDSAEWRSLQCGGDQRHRDRRVQETGGWGLLTRKPTRGRIWHTRGHSNWSHTPWPQCPSHAGTTSQKLTQHGSGAGAIVLPAGRWKIDKADPGDRFLANVCNDYTYHAYRDPIGCISA